MSYTLVVKKLKFSQVEDFKINVKINVKIN